MGLTALTQGRILAVMWSPHTVYVNEIHFVACGDEKQRPVEAKNTGDGHTKE